MQKSLFTIDKSKKEDSVFCAVTLTSDYKGPQKLLTSQFSMKVLFDCIEKADAKG